MSESILRGVCEEIAREIERTDAIAAAGNVRAIVEDNGDVDTAITTALTELGVAAVVSVTSHTRRGMGGRSLTGRLGIEVAFIEKPAVNRDHPGSLTAQGAFEIACARLHGLKLGEFGRLVYEDMRRDDQDDECRVFAAFRMEQSVKPGDAVRWGIDGDVVYGIIQTKRTGRGGTVVFEDGRNGAAARKGVRDRHLTIELTALVPADASDCLPDLGDIFTAPARGVQMTFVCTSASVDEQVEDAATVHLAGRTMPGVTPENQ